MSDNKKPTPSIDLRGDVDQLAAAFQDGFTSGNAEWESTPEHHKNMFREGVRSLVRNSVVIEKRLQFYPMKNRMLLLKIDQNGSGIAKARQAFRW